MPTPSKGKTPTKPTPKVSKLLESEPENPLKEFKEWAGRALTPMEIYRDVSDWKGKCAKLLEALREIVLADTNHRKIAQAAIRRFEENK